MLKTRRHAPSRNLRPMVLMLSMAASEPTMAAFGPYAHGSGIKSLGFGGVSTVVAGETLPIAVNPALAGVVGERYDVGVDLSILDVSAGIRTKLLSFNRDYSSRARYVFVSQGGCAQPISRRFSRDFSGFAAGLGTDYPDSPYERFGGERGSGATFGQIDVAIALAYELSPRNYPGGALNLSYQSLEVVGLGALAIDSGTCRSLACLIQGGRTRDEHVRVLESCSLNAYSA